MKSRFDIDKAIRTAPGADYMEEGISYSIEYIWTDGLCRYAWLTNTDVHRPGTPLQSTDDSQWHVREIDSGREGIFEWLNYITRDGTLWKAKVHCQYRVAPPGPGGAGGYINSWFEHEQFPEGDDHDDEVIHFLDWGRRPWEGRLTAVVRPFPAQPQFMLRRL